MKSIFGQSDVLACIHSPCMYTIPSYIDCVYDTLGSLICTFPTNLSPLEIFLTFQTFK